MNALVLLLLVPTVFGELFQIPVNRPIYNLTTKSMTSYLIEALPIGLMPDVESQLFASECEGKLVCLCYETTNMITENHDLCGRNAYLCYSTSERPIPPRQVAHASESIDHYQYMYSSMEPEKIVKFRHQPINKVNYDFEPFYIDDQSGWAIESIFDPNAPERASIEAHPLKIVEKFRSGGEKPEKAFRAKFASQCHVANSFQVKNVIGGPVYDRANNQPRWMYDSTIV
ncbi:hypothetical protein QR680_019061 [Steinernema hermaphroditum]|uniref:Uncharacterized protein n=1 Tax=Steinernema hermaphroditum TaxID=289476 RepID=A0AA39HJT6_9BILA|nr:hypothetical protein QR680_019061 [Steinernema hermaphroditum]